MCNYRIIEWITQKNNKINIARSGILKLFLCTHLLLLTFRQCHSIFYPLSGSLYILVSSCLIQLGIPSQVQWELLLRCFLKSDINQEFQKDAKLSPPSPDMQNTKHIAHRSVLPRAKLQCDPRENAACCGRQKNTATVALSRGGIPQAVWALPSC